ncbi:hypothetical protein M0802_004432 [Mischocyttarus mexicanus]|nr:hypothetical protein M0802_004432 [Mischocyttarus mexicanus]
MGDRQQFCVRRKRFDLFTHMGIHGRLKRIRKKSVHRISHYSFMFEYASYVVQFSTFSIAPSIWGIFFYVFLTSMMLLGCRDPRGHQPPPDSYSAPPHRPPHQPPYAPPTLGSVLNKPDDGSSLSLARKEASKQASKLANKLASWRKEEDEFSFRKQRAMCVIHKEKNESENPNQLFSRSSSKQGISLDNRNECSSFAY